MFHDQVSVENADLELSKSVFLPCKKKEIKFMLTENSSVICFDDL